MYQRIVFTELSTSDKHSIRPEHVQLENILDYLSLCTVLAESSFRSAHSILWNNFYFILSIQLP